MLKCFAMTNIINICFPFLDNFVAFSTLYLYIHCMYMQYMPHILTKIYVKPTENGAREEKVINKKQYCKQWPVYSFILMT